MRKLSGLILIAILIVVAYVTGSVRAQSSPTVTCDGVSLPVSYQIGRISYSETAQQVCGAFYQYLNEAKGNSLAAETAAAGSVQTQAQENIALALDAFRWRDPVIYNTVMQQYGLSVAPKQ